jgi:hypothetical protein
MRLALGSGIIDTQVLTHTHTHTRIRVCVSVCVCLSVRVCIHIHMLHICEGGWVGWGGDGKGLMCRPSVHA